MANQTPPSAGRSPTTTPASERSTPKEASESVSLQPEPVSEDEVRARAHQLWEQAGRPDGDGQEFWYRAELELRHRGS